MDFPLDNDPLDDFDTADLDASGGDGRGELAWRETYFIFFEADSRPTLTQVEAAVGDAGQRLQIDHLKADDDGLFRSLLVQAPEDNAALDVRYDAGEEVVEQALGFVEQLRDDLEPEQLSRLLEADGRLEVMHFEQLSTGGGDEFDEPSDDAFSEEGLDPATLISVVEALANLTGGLPIDPASGAVVI